MSTLTRTLHKEDCTRVFKKYDPSCERCQELADGAEAREGWSRPQTSRPFKSCGHNDLNPGGYCRTCGSGRDFS